ncbi:putative bifunctional diguanylate cyclase/phosphodiesterase [Marinobacter sp.]|uniref:putative bifunctional diguanylate cyclase/phosphodiesterase n=1 Tax=Marinobacter sp. TaxID=50741 RepID=UPI00384BB8EB
MADTMVRNHEFRSFVDQLPKAVMMTSEDRLITYVNAAFQDITGYRSEDVIGRQPSMLSSGLHNETFYARMWLTLGDSGRWEGLIWNRRKNGEVYPQWLTIYSVREPGHRFFSAVFMDVSELTRLNEPLATMAYYDPLTELPNRVLFMEFLEARLQQRQQSGKTFGVFFVDLDYFKSINDLHGHAVGDQVLCQAALRIRSMLRNDDILARLSGDEFAAIVELTGAGEDMPGICERMISAFRKPLQVDGREHFLSISVGTTLFPRDGTSGLELLEKADKAMYMAKTSGRACCRSFDSRLSQDALNRERLSEALVASLKAAPEEFSLVYQPQFSLADGALVGMETLIRWQHPEFGQVPPAEFVPLAETRGLMHSLTELLVDMIRINLSGLCAGQVPPGLCLSLNLSARHISDDRVDGLLQPLFDDLARLGWIPEVEITETHIMDLSPPCLERLRRFAELGARVAIDDFGTGYSSLAYLHRLPVHVLKIDRRFVARLGGEEREGRIVEAILAIAGALDLETVAEGVETMAQKAELTELKCPRAQGFLLARPMVWPELVSRILDMDQADRGIRA